MSRASRSALVLSCGSALGLALYGYSVSPDIVPVHYGLGGVPDRWGPRGELLAVYVGVVALCTALFFTLPEFVRRTPPSRIHLPNKEYWLSPEHRDQTATKLTAWAHTFGTAVNLFLIALQVLLAPAKDGSAPAPSPLPLLATAAFLLFSAGSCLWLVRSFRLPTEVR
jgi:hypothetical protein